MYIDSRPIVRPLSFLSQLNHTSGGVTVRVREKVVVTICFIDGNIQVRQVELYGWLWVSWSHADTLDTFPHDCALGLLQKDRCICFQAQKNANAILLKDDIYCLKMILNNETLTLHSDVKGAAGSSMLVLSQAAVLSISLWCDLHNLQHWQLIGSDGTHQLPVLQPGEGWCRASLGTTVQS